MCDNELIGQRFEEKNLQLDLSSKFYNGEEKSEDELVKLVLGAYIANIVGEKSIAFALKLGIIEKNSIIRIKNIPHAQAIME